MVNETANRVAIGLPLAVVVACCIVFLPAVWLYLFCAIVALLALYEWASLVQLTHLKAVSYLIANAFLMLVVSWMIFSNSNSGMHDIFLLVTTLFWAFALGRLGRHLTSSNPVSALPKGLHLLLGTGLWFYMPGCFLALAQIPWPQPYSHPSLGWLDMSRVGLVFVLAIPVLTDVMSYFGGRRWGVRKLAPRISKGKTLEGLLIGLLTCIGVCLVVGLIMGVAWPFSVMMGFVLTVVGALGDLFESSVKRDFDTKDSSNILGKHGGFLDRTDSMIIAIPTIALTAQWVSQ